MCTVNLIIKAISANNQSIEILAEGNKLPNIELSNNFPDLDFSLRYLANLYGIHEAYINPHLVYFGTKNGKAEVYYTILTPREFLNEEAISKMCNTVDRFNSQDCLAIRQALSIFPY